MRLLLLASLRAQTGNGTTAKRIQDHLEAAGHECNLKDTFSCESPLAVSKLISENFDAALGIHLYKAGRLLKGSGIPFGIVFGGTDINEDAKCEKKAQVMGTVLDEARFAVSFTEAMRERAISYWPLARSKIYVQAQGIVTVPNISFNWKKYLQSAGITQDHNNLCIFLLICGLRRVKDPLYLVDAFVEWHREDPSVHLIIIGPAVFLDKIDHNFARSSFNRDAVVMESNILLLNIPNSTAETTISYVLKIHIPPIGGTMRKVPSTDHNSQVDPVFAEEVNEKVKRADGVHLLREIPQEDLHAAVKKCFAVVNSSISEGMSAAILEAMDLNVPVLARNIPGNAAIIMHKATGLLYSNPEEFVQLSKSLIKDPSLQREIVTRAKEYVTKHHLWEDERNAYQNLVLRLH